MRDSDEKLKVSLEKAVSGPSGKNCFWDLKLYLFIFLFKKEEMLWWKFGKHLPKVPKESHWQHRSFILQLDCENRRE